jgi:small secreted domain DUF320
MISPRSPSLAGDARERLDNYLHIGCSSSGREFAMYGRIHVIKKLAAAGVVAAASGALLLGSPAYADNDTSGAGGLLSGNQAVIPISIPINACGNSVALIGLAGSGCRGGASVGHGHRYPIF